MSELQRDSASPVIHIAYLSGESLHSDAVAAILGDSPFETRLNRIDERDSLISALESRPPDLILSDVAISSFTALDALKWIREKYPSLKFILIADELDPDLSMQAAKFGISALLLRSRIEELPEIIEALFVPEVGDSSREDSSHDISSYLGPALEKTWDMVVVTNSRGEILYVNRAFEQRTGYESTKVMGENPRILKGKNQPPGLYEDLWATLLAGRVWRGQFTNRRKNGEFYPEETTITPIRNHKEQIEAFVAIKRDVSERRRLEEDLRLSHKLEALGRMAGGIAHNFNNLMTAAMASTDILLFKDTLSSEDRQEVDNIREVLGRASDLTKHLLSMSSHQFFSWENFDLRAFVEDQLKLYREVLPENIVLGFSPSGLPAMIRADRKHLGQALLNIILNARDAMPRGGRIDLSCRPGHIGGAPENSTRKPDEGYVALEIEDNGPGMDPKTLSRVFDPFFTTREERGRVGLGLNIVHGIIQQHGGYLEVDSAPGRGSRFMIYLPLAKTIISPETPTEEKHQPLSPPGKEEAPILVVEDEAPLRKAILRILKNFQLEGVAAGDAERALELVKQGLRPRLIISDVRLPGMKGPELFREIRAMAETIPFLFCSGFSREDLDEELSGVDNAAFISKPFSAEELGEAVRKLIKT